MEADGAPLQGSYRESLLRALKSVKQSGSFSAEHTLEQFCPPGLEVPDLGPIGLPLIPHQAQQLAQICSPAPFGRRDATIFDESVRQCLQLSPQEFRLAGSGWAAQVQQLANGRVKRDLGIPESVKVIPSLYKLLLYEAGGHFTCHRDTEKEDGMFGTLVIALPSAHSGGELVVRHAGQERIIDFGSKNLYQIHYAAFFADCEHELLPVRSGYRLALIYNLIGQGSTRVPHPADNTAAAQQIAQAIEGWSRDNAGPQKLVIPLAHHYSSKSLTFDTLRGTDMATIDVLLQAAKVRGSQPFHCYLGMVEKYEEGFEDSIDRVGISETRLRDLVAADGEAESYDSLEFSKTELVPETALSNRGWDTVKAGEDTGNEGVKEERWYYEAAVIIWLDKKHWEIYHSQQSEQGSQGEAATVTDLVLQHGHLSLADELRAGLDALCACVKSLTDEDAWKLADLIVRRGTTKLAGAFLFHYHGPGASTAAPIVSLLGDAFGWRELQVPILSAVRASIDPKNLARVFWLLADIAPPPANDPGLASNTVENDAAQKRLQSGDESACVETWADAVDILFHRLRHLPWAVHSDYWVDYKCIRFGPLDMTATEAFLAAAQRCGPGEWATLNSFFASGLVAASVTAATELLSRIAVEEEVGCAAERGLSPAAAGFCRAVADALVAALLAEEDPPPPPHWQRKPTNPARSPSWVCDLLESLHCLGVRADVMDSLFKHFFDTPRLHNFDATIIPSLERLFVWLGPARADKTPWFATLCARCLEEREKVCVKPPKPRNWAMEASCGCECKSCQKLLKLCRDPVSSYTSLFDLQEDEKEHVRDSVRRYGMPLWEAEEPGSYPQALTWIKEGSNGSDDTAKARMAVALQDAYVKNTKKLEDTRALISRMLPNILQNG